MKARVKSYLIFISEHDVWKAKRFKTSYPEHVLLLSFLHLLFSKYQMSFSVHVIFFSPVQCVFTGDLNTC